MNKDQQTLISIDIYCNFFTLQFFHKKCLLLSLISNKHFVIWIKVILLYFNDY